MAGAAQLRAGAPAAGVLMANTSTGTIIAVDKRATIFPRHRTSPPHTHTAAMHGEHNHTKIAPLPSKITYIKMDPLNPIRNGFAN
eukprot:COSAG05_NODE_3970_length_1744_cov_4.354407_2_plen_84_part_01